jgi:hypothetical protein
MAASAQSRKKRIEMSYLEEARRASSIFPSGDLIPHEKPDFLLRADAGTIGIEVTELCREGPRAQGGKLSKVPDKARERYHQLANTGPIDVSAAFAPNTENIGFHQLTNGLVNFVYANRRDRGAFDWNECELPEGYCHIAIHPALEATGRWRTFNAFDTTLAPKELLDSCIAGKNLRLADYRVAAREIWLLIVNDQCLGAGEVYARPDHLAEWRFAFDFEKVLLFSREPGGSGEVIELQRADCSHSLD